jgi:hypothetical protein
MNCVSRRESVVGLSGSLNAAAIRIYHASVRALLVNRFLDQVG